MTTLDDLTQPIGDRGAADWNDDGFVIYKNLIPHEMLDAYAAEWMANNGPVILTDMANDHDGVPLYTIEARRRGGYNETGYMRNPALFDICTYGPLGLAIEKLLGEPGGVHLNLTGWISTFRDWHQDTYLNPAHVGDSYAAVWIAFDDVHPDAGPFEYAPGSHRWHELTQEKIGQVVDLSDPMWPAHTEAILTPLVEAEIEKRGATKVKYLPKKGDVLIWHPRLYHRGTVPNQPDAFRPALIAHYSGINHRADMPAAQQAGPGQGWFFPIHQQAELAHSMMNGGQ